MSLRLEMLQVARLAPSLLGESTALIRAFLQHQQNADGGFKDRAGRSDLYYTVFGLDGLLALQAAPLTVPVTSYLRQFEDGAGLDFVHLCCLARCWAAAADLARAGKAGRVEFDEVCPPGIRKGLIARIESWRSQDGGYHPVQGHARGSAYGCFLACAACQDLRVSLPEASRLLACLNGLATPEGAWINDPGTRNGSTTATAAAVALFRQLNARIGEETGRWLRARCDPGGGFRAAPDAPLPDLLSTATGLHALAGLQIPLAEIREGCLDFVDSLWTNAGAFHGHWADDQPDCEYTFYGLLALGHLSA